MKGARFNYSSRPKRCLYLRDDRASTTTSPEGCLPLWKSRARGPPMSLATDIYERHPYRTAVLRDGLEQKRKPDWASESRIQSGFRRDLDWASESRLLRIEIGFILTRQPLRIDILTSFFLFVSFSDS